jgi:histidyl-tRNA synthetase
MSDRIIKPGCPSGVRDLLPQQAAQRRDIINRVIDIYELFGFVPLETSMLEREEVLTGGDPDFSKQIFRIKDPSKNRDPLALRFDLTVPLARVVAQYPELPKPFKRWQMGRVFRGEKPQAGRYREFAQLDADTVGSASLLADVEIINMIYLVMGKLGVNNFMIRVNTRQILNALPFYAGFDPAKIAAVLRILDKLDKIGLDGVIVELASQPTNEWDESPGLPNDVIDKLVSFINIRGNNQEIQSQLDQLMGPVPEATTGLRELQEIVRGVEAAGVDSNCWKLDLSVARGLGYYTGPVFETILTDLPEFGSVFSGGRFDGLVSRFSKQSIPATGASVGVDRLFTAMEQLGLLNDKAIVRPEVVVICPDDSIRFESVKAAAELRQNGVRTELYMGSETNVGSQIGYAAKRGAQFVVIIGLEEFSNRQVAIKNLITRKQVVVDRNQMCANIMER